MRSLFQVAVIFPLILLFSCSKEKKANEWVVMKITTKDYYDGKNIKATAWLHYELYNHGTYAGEWYTDRMAINGAGEIYIKEKIPEGAKNIYLEVFGPDEYLYGVNEPIPIDLVEKSQYLYRKEISPKNEEDVYLKLKPYFKIRLHTHVIDCGGHDDSLFFANTLVSTGCPDYYYYTLGDQDYYWRRQDKHIPITLIRNGQTFDLSQTFDLNKDSINTIYFEF